MTSPKAQDGKLLTRAPVSFSGQKRCWLLAWPVSRVLHHGQIFPGHLCRGSSGTERQESVLSLGAAPAPGRIPQEGQMEPMEQAGNAAGLFWQEI